MARNENNNERAIVIAFLRAGYPGLAFGTVVIRSLMKMSIIGFLAGGGLLMGQSGIAWVAETLPAFLR